MFETAEIGRKTAKVDYEREVARLRPDLLRLQGELARANFPVIIVIAGVEGAGKSETVNLLLEWMDARGIRTYAFGDPSDEERERPRFWRYWMALPPRGKIGILFGSWYSEPFNARAVRRIKTARLDQELDRIIEFERMLTDEGALVLKFWLHLSKHGLKRRLQTLKKDAATRWRLTPLDFESLKQYDKLRAVAEHALRRTNTANAPWHVVEGTDPRYRSLAVTGIIRAALEERLHTRPTRGRKPKPVARKKVALPVPAPVNIINRLDLTLALDDKKYNEELDRYQACLNRLVQRLPAEGCSLILVFEGQDAAGKGGAIRRVTAALDARQYDEILIAAPTEEERAQPYLWRFWRHLPRQGRVTIYDRSWYGRVLVERLEGFCAPADWQRAFNEINAFEEQLTEAGSIIVKFWMAISAEEQLRRFREREATPYKQYKMSREDWRNRAKWPAYEAAACDMIERTSTQNAPWTLVEANDKKWARIKVLKTICRRLETALDSHA